MGSTPSGPEQNHLLSFNRHLTCSPVKRVELGTYLAPVLNLNIDFSEIIQSNLNSEEVSIALHLPFCHVCQEKILALSTTMVGLAHHLSIRLHQFSSFPLN